MKKTRFLLSLAFVLSLAASAAYAQTPDLSGEWKLNPGLSDLGEMAAANPDIAFSIRQEGGVLTIRKNINVQGKEIVKNFRYTLDGKESFNDGESLKGLKGTAAFEKGILIVRAEQEGTTMHISGNDPPEIEYFKFDSVEEFSLSSDGKTLTVVQTAQLPDGSRKTTFVFDKAAA